MRNTHYLYIISLFLLGCTKETEPLDYENIELQPYIIDSYYADARNLYFNEILQNESHFNRNDPVLDEQEIEQILKLIQAVYDTDSPARDSVFVKHSIHSRYCFSFNSISLKVDTSRPEIQKLADNEIPTGSGELDRLLKAYAFDSVVPAYSYPDFEWLTIYTAEDYNMIPIQEKFENLPSVKIAEFNRGCIGDGSNITLTRDRSSATLTFSIGSGDCPAGCIYHKYWKFRITNGSAEFIRSYED